MIWDRERARKRRAKRLPVANSFSKKERHYLRISMESSGITEILETQHFKGALKKNELCHPPNLPPFQFQSSEIHWVPTPVPAPVSSVTSPQQLLGAAPSATWQTNWTVQLILQLGNVKANLTFNHAPKHWHSNQKALLRPLESGVSFCQHSVSLRGTSFPLWRAEWMARGKKKAKGFLA